MVIFILIFLFLKKKLDNIDFLKIKTNKCYGDYINYVVLLLYIILYTLWDHQPFYSGVV